MSDPVRLNPLWFILEDALLLAQEKLGQFSLDTDFSDKIRLAFGDEVDVEAAISLVQELAQPNSSLLPKIEIRSQSEINGAKGAFSGSNYTIYLSQEFLAENSQDIPAISAVIIEELGHFIDSRLNTSDTPGDEGEIFSALVRGESLEPSTLQRLQEEDDTVVVTLDNQTIQLEQATIGANPAFDLIGLTRLRNDPQFAGIDGSGFSVAVLDTGLDATHSLISPNFRTFADFVEGRTTAYDSGSHGTHVAGTVGARDENIGVAPAVGLIGVRAIGPFTAVRDGLLWVLNNRNQYNIIAVNMSLGSSETFLTNNSQITGGVITEVNDIINRLENAGVTVVSAAGNDYFTGQRQGVSFPGISSTINVGAVWQDGRYSGIGWGDGGADYTTGADRLTSFSQRLDEPSNAYDTLFAPGALITSAVPGGGLDQSAGTSQASPHIAGAVALLQEAALQFGGRLLTPAEVTEIFRSTGDVIRDGDDENDNVPNTNTTYSRLNIYNAISEVKRRSGQVAPPPPGGGAGDPNGTITGAYRVPTVLNGFEIDLINGSIGTDGGTTQVGNKDVDIFRFEVTIPGTVTIELSSRLDAPNDFDTLLRLFDSSGNELAFDDDNGASLFSLLEVPLATGIYYAGVSGYNNRNYNPNVAGSGVVAAVGNYSIQFGLKDTDFNGLLANAVDITLGNDLDPFDFANGFIGADNGRPVGTADVDLFKVIAPDNGTLYIDIDTPFNDDYVDSFLRVFEADGRQAFFEDTGARIDSDDDLSFDKDGATEFTDSRYPNLVFEDPTDRTVFQGHRTDSFIAGRVRRGEVLYLGVSDYLNQDYNTQNLDGRSTRGPGGFYNLNVQFQNNDRDGSIARAIPNLPLPVTGQSGTIGRDSDPLTGQEFEVGDLDVDFVKIRSATTGVLEIDIDSYENTALSTPVDTVISIFNPNGQLLAENDDTSGLDPLLQYRVQANTDYFVAVSGYGNDSFDPLALGSGSPGDTGQYIFKSRLLSAAQSFGILSDNAIGYPSVQTANIGSTIFGDIGEDNDFEIGATDIDLYRFVANSSERIRIRTSTYEEFSADTFLRVFDTNGTEIAFNDDENSNTRGSYLEVDVTAGNQYYIGVNGNSSQARNYDALTGNGAVAGSEGIYTLTIKNNDPLTAPVYRFYNAQSRGHFFTASQSERDTVLANPQWGYTYEDGFGFKASTTPGQNLLEVFRFYNAQSRGHFFTTNTQERDTVLANPQWGYTYEQGFGFYAHGIDANLGSDVYRFYNAQSRGHFFTINPNERDTVLANPQWGYTYEPGFGFEAKP